MYHGESVESIEPESGGISIIWSVVVKFSFQGICCHFGSVSGYQPAVYPVGCSAPTAGRGRRLAAGDDRQELEGVAVLGLVAGQLPLAVDHDDPELEFRRPRPLSYASGGTAC